MEWRETNGWSTHNDRIKYYNNNKIKIVMETHGRFGSLHKNKNYV